MGSEIPYALIPLVVSIILGVVYLVRPEVSLRSKAVVTTAIAASLIVWRWYPQWLVIATLLQVGASIYVLLYFKVQGHEA